MPVHTTYTQARANLAKLCDRVTGDHELVIIERRGREAVAMIAASELAGLVETAHLLRSPKNARRILAALQRAREATVPPQSLEDLRTELGLD